MTNLSREKCARFFYDLHMSKDSQPPNRVLNTDSHRHTICSTDIFDASILQILYIFFELDKDTCVNDAFLLSNAFFKLKTNVLVAPVLNVSCIINRSAARSSGVSKWRLSRGNLDGCIFFSQCRPVRPEAVQLDRLHC